jgi:hypothetical protein
LIAIAAAVALTSTAAFAGATVQGSPRAVTVEATNASIEDILAALGKSFDVRINSTADLNKQLNGTYEGSLTQVVTRVLEGYNFIVKSSNGHLMVSVLGSRTGTAVARAVTPPPAVATPAAPTQAAVTPAAPPAAAVAAKAPAANPDQGKAASPPRDIAKEQAAPAASSPNLPQPIMVAQGGPMPPMPTPGQASGPVPTATPSNVAAPMPVPPPPGSPPMQGPMPTKSNVEPPSFSAMTKPGTAAPPVPKGNAVSPPAGAPPPPAEPKK